MTVTKFYVHPDPQQRERQEAARKQALASVKAGAIRWGATGLGTNGFVYAARVARVEQLEGLEVLIALYELRNAGRLVVNDLTGVVSARAGAR